MTKRFHRVWKAHRGRGDVTTSTRLAVVITIVWPEIEASLDFEFDYEEVVHNRSSRRFLECGDSYAV